MKSLPPAARFDRRQASRAGVRCGAHLILTQ